MYHSKQWYAYASLGVFSIIVGAVGFCSGPSALPVPFAQGSECHYRYVPNAGPSYVLPDPLCTPGEVNPNVTEDNIRTTICVRGWTATVRPGVSFTSGLKVEQMKRYGATGRTIDYEEDHLIPLELGGSPDDPKNLWPEPGGVPNPKDSIENDLRQRVCSGQLLLADAQQRIRTDWTRALEGIP